MTIDEAIFNIENLTDNYVRITVKNIKLRDKFVDTLIMAIDELYKSKWKSVEDELPKDEKEVLVKLNYTADYEEKYKFAGYSIARYLKFDDGGHWADNKYGYLEWDKFSDGRGGSSWYKVVEWKEI